MAYTSKKQKFTIPGTLIKTKAGSYLAYYEHRTDIIANGENEKDAIKNLKKMYEVVKKHEEQDEDSKPLDLPPATKKSYFSVKLDSI